MCMFPMLSTQLSSKTAGILPLLSFPTTQHSKGANGPKRESLAETEIENTLLTHFVEYGGSI